MVVVVVVGLEEVDVVFAEVLVVEDSEVPAVEDAEVDGLAELVVPGCLDAVVVRAVFVAVDDALVFVDSVFLSMSFVVSVTVETETAASVVFSVVPTAFSSTISAFSDPSVASVSLLSSGTLSKTLSVAISVFSWI